MTRHGEPTIAVAVATGPLPRPSPASGSCGAASSNWQQPDRARNPSRPAGLQVGLRAESSLAGGLGVCRLRDSERPRDGSPPRPHACGKMETQILSKAARVRAGRVAPGSFLRGQWPGPMHTEAVAAGSRSQGPGSESRFRMPHKHCSFAISIANAYCKGRGRPPPQRLHRNPPAAHRPVTAKTRARASQPTPQYVVATAADDDAVAAAADGLDRDQPPQAPIRRRLPAPPPPPPPPRRTPPRGPRGVP